VSVDSRWRIVEMELWDRDAIELSWEGDDEGDDSSFSAIRAEAD